MAKLSHTDSRRMYSWWWDSHISPKNSKWLQENLTDMDMKVKSMIKLIEEDADSFARRAEMYYKKRPELMKMVEELYRAYRALAERYNHATGVIRHAHRTMSEAFPNQVPLMFGDDSYDAKMPEVSTPIGEFADESDSCTEKTSLKQFNDHIRSVERIRKGLNFDEAEEKELINGNSHSNDKRSPNFDKENINEEILALKEALSRVEAEKEAGIIQYQHSLDKLSQLETEISKTREDFEELSNHAREAEDEVAFLKEKITTLELEKESKLQDYQKSVEKLNVTANTAEIEAQSVKREPDKLHTEKDASLDQYLQSPGTMTSLENKLRLVEEDGMILKERVEKAESKVKALGQTISTLAEEKEAAAKQYQQCLDLISSLEQKLVRANEEANRLNNEITYGALELKSAEEQCLLLERSNKSLHAELESLLQEERSRFVEAETALLTLQHLHEQTQKELRAMASEIQSRAQLLKVAETKNRDLQDEVVKVKGENKHLEELNETSALSIKEMQSEISSLMESKGKLEEEAELRLDQRNSLQQEIYCLKEELKDLNGKHFSVLDQVHAVGLSPESLGPSVIELQDENYRLKETYQRESGEKMALLEKLAVFEQLLEKNSLLETSISDLNGELEAVRGKLQELEKTCELLSEEKSTLLEEKAALVSQLQEKNKNLEILSKNNTVLENFLSNVHRMLEALKDKSKVLEDSCQFLLDEKAGLMSERDELASQLENTRAELDDLGKLYTELKFRCTNLEKEKESTLRKADELNMTLEVERRENASYIQKIEQDDFYIKQLFDKLHTLKNSLCKAEEENLGSSIELLVLVAWIRQLILGSQNLEAARNTIEHERKTLSSLVEELNVKLADRQREKSLLSQEKMSLIDNIQHLEGKNIFLEEENHILCGKLLALENLSLIFKIFVDEKFVVFREIGDDRNKLRNMNAALIEKLSSTEEKLEASKANNHNLKETLKKTRGELKLVVTDRDQLRVETENGKLLLNEIAVQLHEAEETISHLEKQKRDLNESVENLKMDCYVAKMARGHQENHILKLSADNELMRKEKKLLAEANQKLESDLKKLREEHDLMKTREESLSIELQKKMTEMNEMENKATFFFGHYQCSMVSQLLYEQKFNELHDVCLGYRDQNERLEARLAAYGPEILLLKECILSLENQTHIHIKFPNPKNEDLQGVNNSNESPADLHHLTVRLRAITKVASELKDLLLQEKADLHSKLQHTTKQLESLQSDNGPHRRHRRRPASEITKDIVLDQASDGSSVGPSKRNSLTIDPCNQMVELWETSDPDGSVGLTVSRSKKITETVECRRLKSIKKQKSPFILSEISKTPNGSFKDGTSSRRRVLERLDSDVQKLSNLQITVHDLKRKLEATEKGKRGKAAVECEALKGQLDEAGSAVVRLFELNGRLMKSIDKGWSFSPEKSMPFDLEKEGSVRRRRAAEQARRMSERIGRVQLEVQRLQFVLMKMDEVKNRAWEGRRRVLLRDYLYGRTGQGQKRKKTQFCTCVQASAVDE